MNIDIGPIEEWFVCFMTKSAKRWANWLPGRFKHVMAFTAMRDGLWLFLDAAPFNRQLVVTPAEAGAALLTQVIDDSIEIVCLPAGKFRRRGAWCVPAVIAATGLPSCALRPDTLYRDCLAHGGYVIHAAVDHGQPLRRDSGAGRRAQSPGTGAGPVQPGEG